MSAGGRNQRATAYALPTTSDVAPCRAHTTGRSTLPPELQFARANVELAHSEKPCKCGRPNCDIIENPITDAELIAWARKNTRPVEPGRFVD